MLFHIFTTFHCQCHTAIYRPPKTGRVVVQPITTVTDFISVNPDLTALNIQGGQKSKPLPNFQKIVLNRVKVCLSSSN